MERGVGSFALPVFCLMIGGRSLVGCARVGGRALGWGAVMWGSNGILHFAFAASEHVHGAVKPTRGTLARL